MGKVINILGTEYEFDITTAKKDTRLNNLDGYCDSYEKRIALEDDYDERSNGSIKNFPSFKKTTKRHEIVHAYLFESGLTDYAENERIVEWIAWQFPKLLKSFNEVDAL